MFDRRDASFADRGAWCFDTIFSDETKTVEIQVNRNDFTESTALSYAQFYGEAIGRIPKFLRRDLQTVWIHDGNDGFGGGNNNLLIHTGQGESYIRDGILDETFIHESTHTSLDSYLYGTTEWNDAVAADGIFISDYARDNPQREDASETSLVWFATRYTPESFSDEELLSWEANMGNRFKVFDELCEEMSPYEDCKFCSRTECGLTNTLF